MKNTRFYICPHCRNVAEMIYDTDIPLNCCGVQMTELVPGAVSASEEKHIPQVEVADGAVEVRVGAAEHPMEQAHWIEWVQLVTDQGSARKVLKPGTVPRVRFLLEDERPLAVYAYCNLHGLWMTRLDG